MFTTLQPSGQSSRSIPRHPIAAIAGKPAQPHVLEALAAFAVTIRAERDEEIVGQGEAAGYCYLVVSGCVRSVRLMEDGRRQVGEFLFPGDLFGWEALDEHDFGAEAVTR